MSDQILREKLIRLAHANPELREHVLPLLKDGIEKNAKFVHMPDAMTTSWNHWSDNMGQAFEECAAYVKALKLGTVSGLRAYEEEGANVSANIKMCQKNLIEAETKLQSARKNFDKVLRIMK